MRKLVFVLAISLLLSKSGVFAQQSEPTVRAKFLMEAGVEFGGDEILKVFFTNGEDQKMRAGQGGYIGVGTEVQFSQVKQLMLRASVGLKYTTTAADNANIRLTRFPIQLTPFWKIDDDFRLGVGITTHLSPRLKGDGFLPDVDFTSTAGPRLEFGWRWLALTYTAMRYKYGSNSTVSANAFGAMVSFTLPNSSKFKR
ncbi:MAG: hypothetical protein EAY75_08410 [Bacteroidetes bacterium]|nr:MAG: hypothetical protein EAY75_08410 [Bacteroidota bacterium]